MYQCKDDGELYGAAWLTNKKTLLHINEAWKFHPPGKPNQTIYQRGMRGVYNLEQSTWLMVQAADNFQSHNHTYKGAHTVWHADVHAATHTRVCRH